MMNSLTHIDFIIFNKLDKSPVLAIEVDGHDYHKEGTVQYKRDRKKDSILEKYEIPFQRFNTTGSNEEQILVSRLNKILKY